MPGIVWKSVHGKKYMVLRWKKWINGKSRIVKEIYIGDEERLARILENPAEGAEVMAMGFGATASVLSIEKDMGIKGMINETVGHKGKGLSPGDYVLLFAFNRLSDPRSKNGIGSWMRGDFASTLYPEVTSQGYWNMMDRFSEDHMKAIKERIRDRLIELGYDRSKLFFDGSNFYTYMKENDMAKRGHNKQHRYDLNQIAYYLEANEDYIPFYGDSYPGNEPDVNTFPMIVENLPADATVIFDRGYNSKFNVNLLHGRKYIGALIQSDHRDLMAMPIEKDSFIETSKSVYGKTHRIIVYHSRKLEKKQIIGFMKHFKKIYAEAKKIMQSGDSDAMERTRYYLESRNMNETILLPSLKIDNKKMEERFRIFGKNALFTNIDDMKAEDLIELYRKRNRIEHCFRTISMGDLAKPEYHWTPQKIRVHMFFSHIAYLYLALIHYRIRESVSLTSTTEVLRTIRITMLVRGKSVSKVVTSHDERGKEAIKVLELEKLI
jgi:transposase